MWVLASVHPLAEKRCPCNTACFQSHWDFAECKWHGCPEGRLCYRSGGEHKLDWKAPTVRENVPQIAGENLSLIMGKTKNRKLKNNIEPQKIQPEASWERSKDENIPENRVNLLLYTLLQWDIDVLSLPSIYGPGLLTQSSISLERSCDMLIGCIPAFPCLFYCVFTLIHMVLKYCMQLFILKFGSA